MSGSAMASSMVWNKPSGEELPDRLGLLHVARQHAGGRSLEEEQRQAEQVAERARGQPPVDLAGDEQHEVVAGVAEDAVEQRQDAEDQHQRIQGLIAAVGDDLVDEDLEHERRREGDHRRHRRGHRDVPEQALVAQQLGQEPAQAERLALVAQPLHALAQNQRAVPAVDELRARHQRRLLVPGHRVEHRQRRPVRTFDGVEHDHPVAGLLLGHDRVGVAEGGQFLPVAARQHAAAQADLLHDPQDRAQGVRFPDLREVLRLELHAAVQADHEQASQRRVVRRPGVGYGAVHGAAFAFALRPLWRRSGFAGGTGRWLRVACRRGCRAPSAGAARGRTTGSSRA